MKKTILNSLIGSMFFIIGVAVFGIIALKGYAAISTVSSGTPLTADTWNTMVSNFFWGSGNGGIYYNGKVGIGTSSPNKQLHIKTSAGNNAELNIQSGDQPYWAIYQDESSQELRFWNTSNRVTITNGGNLSAAGLCLNGTCKTDWSQVSGTSSANYTGTCDSSHKGYTGLFSNSFKVCDGSIWLEVNKVGNNGLSSSYPGLSCNDILTSYPASGNGTYWIDPNGGLTTDSFQVYCDMLSDGGGWTLVARMYTANATLRDRNAVGTLIAPDQSSDAKLSDATINLLRGTRTSSIMKITSGSLKSFHQENKEFCATCDGANAILKASSSVSGPRNSCTQRGGHYGINNYSCSVDYIIYAYGSTGTYPTTTGTLRVR